MREPLDQQAERENDDDQDDQWPVAARGTGLAAAPGARARYRLRARDRAHVGNRVGGLIDAREGPQGTEGHGSAVPGIRAVGWVDFEECGLA